jgi:hypothetical protein
MIFLCLEPGLPGRVGGIGDPGQLNEIVGPPGPPGKCFCLENVRVVAWNLILFKKLQIVTWT